MNVTPQSRLKPVQLVVRQDRNGYIVEDAANRDYYEMSELCVIALQRMGEGETLETIERELSARFPDEDVDLAGFAEQLLELRLVAELDGIPIRKDNGEARGRNDAEKAKTSGGFGWISPSFARMLFHPAMRWLYAGAIVANVALLAAKPDLFPRFRDAFPFDSMALNSATWLGLSFALLLLHELGHITAVRSFGLPAKLGVGHRFVFVVFETEMDGIWSLTPKQRNRAFLAGMGVDQLVLLVCLLVQTALPGDPEIVRKLAALAVLDLVVKLAFQCCLFMKTDLYYVVENGTGCYNLMERSCSWLGRKLSGREGREKGREEEPRAVRWYAVVYAAGYVLNLAIVALYFAPQLVVSLATALPRLAVPDDAARFWDAVVFVLEIVVLGSLLLRSLMKNRTGRPRDDRHGVQPGPHMEP
ncbi:peptidase [Paenibacillus sp. GYB003]|uniref:peptidase n=1 Tax=Paenibacillus sp. GYB003 TaxID=2994392 RepID=UPI002F9615D8